MVMRGSKLRVGEAIRPHRFRNELLEMLTNRFREEAMLFQDHLAAKVQVSQRTNHGVVCPLEGFDYTVEFVRGRGHEGLLQGIVEPAAQLGGSHRASADLDASPDTRSALARPHLAQRRPTHRRR